MLAGINRRCFSQAGSFPGGVFFLAAKWNFPFNMTRPGIISPLDAHYNMSFRDYLVN